MFDDLIKTIKAQLHDRITSPLFSSFVISWCGWNYKLLIILFSGMNAVEKISYINKELYLSWVGVACYGFFFPALTSLLIIYVYPYPAKVTYEFYKRRQVELKKIQQAIDDETPLTKEEAKKIRGDALKLSIEFEQQIEKLQEENIGLRKIIKENVSVNSLGPNTSSDDSSQLVGGQQVESFTPATSIGRGLHYDDQEDEDLSPFVLDENDTDKKSELLVTAEEFVKASVENLIQEKKVFRGYKFLVSLVDNEISIAVTPKEGKMKYFRYSMNLAKGVGLGTETTRIKKEFERDFTEFVDRIKVFQLENK